MWLQATWCLSWENCCLYKQRPGAFPGRPHAFCGRLHSLLFVDFYTTQYVYLSTYNIDANTYSIKHIYTHTYICICVCYMYMSYMNMPN